MQWNKRRESEQTLQGIEGVHDISDDIIAHGATHDQHEEFLRKVMRRVRECGLTFHLKKNQFSMSELTFVGHVLSSSGVGVTADKVGVSNGLWEHLQACKQCVHFCKHEQWSLLSCEQPALTNGKQRALRKIFRQLVVLRLVIWLTPSKQDNRCKAR